MTAEEFARRNRDASNADLALWYQDLLGQYDRTVLHNDEEAAQRLAEVSDTLIDYSRLLIDRLLTAGDRPLPAVWLTQLNSAGPAEIIGIFSSPERAKKACQDRANEYMGERSTPALMWRGVHVVASLAGHWSASHHHLAAGMQLFQATRYEVDQEQESTS